MAVDFKHLRMRLFFCCIITFTSFYSFANEISFELKNEEIIDIPISIIKIIKTIDVMINDLGGYERLQAEEPIKLLLETSNENFKLILGILLRNKDIIESNLSIDTSGLNLTDALKNSLISFDSKTLLDLLVIADFLDIEILKIAITEHWLDNFSAQIADIHNISSDLKEIIIRRISSCKFMEIMWKNDNSIEERHNTKEEETYQIALKIYYDKIVPSSTAKKTCMEIYLNHLVAQYILYYKNGNISLYASGYS